MIRTHGRYPYSSIVARPVSVHPFVMGRPYRVRHLRRFFEHIAPHRDRIWLTRPRDICAHIESLRPKAPCGPAIRDLSGPTSPASSLLSSPPDLIRGPAMT